MFFGESNRSLLDCVSISVTRKLDRKSSLSFLFVLLLCGSLVAGTYTVSAESDEPIRFYAFTLFSPLNKTYTSKVLTLNLTFTAGIGVQYSLYYHLDGRYQKAIPFVIDNPNNEMHVTYAAHASIVLPSLSSGSHSVTVFLICSGLIRKPPSYDGTVYFTIYPSGRILDLTAPEISKLSVENKIYAESDIPLHFIVNENTSQLEYSLDGNSNITIAGNMTLIGLSTGQHNVTLYARGVAGNTGASETVAFTIAGETELFSTVLVAVALVSMAVVGVGLAVYIKKRERQKAHVSTTAGQ